MRFDAPHFLALIPLAAVLLTGLHLWAGHRRRVLLGRFGSCATVSKLSRGASPGRRRWKFLLVAGAVCLIAFALARPQYGTEVSPMRRRGVEVVIAIDCSTSMLSEDVAPSRFQRARAQLRGLIRRLEGDSVAILAFAGIPIVQCPMTSDYGMALNMLDSLEIDSVPVQGTAIGDAIRKATDSFRTAKGYRVLVLLTDGEDHEGKPLEAAKAAAEQGVRIYAIGIGSAQGAPIPLPAGGYKEEGGSKVNSRLDFDTLTQIALATGGKAILANAAGDAELKVIAQDIAALKQADLQAKTTVVHTERFQYFLFPALLFLIVEMLLGERRTVSAAPDAGRFE